MNLIIHIIELNLKQTILTQMYYNQYFPLIIMGNQENFRKSTIRKSSLISDFAKVKTQKIKCKE